MVHHDVLKDSIQNNNKSLTFQLGEDGVMEIYHVHDTEKKKNLSMVPNIDEFDKDYKRITEMVNEGFMRSYCFQRLQLLSSAFRMHVTMNRSIEALEQVNLLGTDFL